MENETVTPQPQTATPNPVAPKRSASYPSMSVLDAYNFAAKINSKFSNAEVSRKEMANVLKVHDNTISRQVAAVAAYGFFEKKMKKGDTDYKYQLTQLFTDIFMPENEKQKRICFITAFSKPKLYSDLIAKFDGLVIPDELPNTLIKHHEITATAAKEVADIFIKSGTEVGVINENRVLSYKVTLGAVQKTQYAEVVEEPNTNGHSGGAAPSNNTPVLLEQPPFITPNDRKIPIHLTKNKMAYFMYPADISANDIKIVEYEVKGILLRLELEQEEEKTKGATQPQ
jgi:hypothetical protein